jgi:hypothetical protein
MRRTGDVWVALALSAFAVVACSDPHGGTLPSPSPAPSATSATPTAVNLRTSLTNALHGYFDALYTAGLDPANKTDALAALVDPSCTCMRTVDVLREEARQGRSIDYRYTLKDVAVIEVGELGGNIRYTVMQSAGAERDHDGRVIEAYPASTARFSAHFTRSGDAWRLDRVTEFR